MQDSPNAVPDRVPLPSSVRSSYLRALLLAVIGLATGLFGLLLLVLQFMIWLVSGRMPGISLANVIGVSALSSNPAGWRTVLAFALALPLPMTAVAAGLIMVAVGTSMAFDLLRKVN
ncbi:hypothetical protein [Sphingomonas sp. PAMC 26605]|uniref:hypothetical protein n=1 Tax=Sphingomonas sp. PAMC 26605 TaxID=1112214 RepID=UPI00026CD1E6|nr:hypothetical protein [Sphingomonas sp. PAMC 26605]